MSSHPPDTLVIGGACGTLGCTRNSFGHPTSLSLMPYPFTSNQGVASVYRSTLLLSTMITWHLAVSGGSFSSCLTVLSSLASRIFLSVRYCHQQCQLGIFSSSNLCYWQCPLGIFVSSDLYVVPYPGESRCSYKLLWISNHNACHGIVSANAIA